MLAAFWFGQLEMFEANANTTHPLTNTAKSNIFLFINQPHLLTINLEPGGDG